MRASDPINFIIRTDDRERAGRFLTPVLTRYRRAHVDYEPWDPTDPPGFYVQSVGDVARERACIVKAIDHRLREDSDIDPAYRCYERSYPLYEEELGEYGKLVKVTMTFDGSDSKELFSRIRASRSNHRIVLHCAEQSIYVHLERELRSLGYRVQMAHGEEDSECGIRVGGVPEVLIKEVQWMVWMETGEELKWSQEWGDEDHDIFVNLPKAAIRTTNDFAGTVTVSDREMFSWLPRTRSRQGRLFVERGAARVRIGNVELPVRSGVVQSVPSLDTFRHLCMDQGTALNLLFAAESYLVREPALYTGPTSTGKSMVVAYLAALLNQPHARVGFASDQDSGALVGRFQPCGSVSDLSPMLKGWQNERSVLHKASLDILEGVRQQARPLRAIEIHAVHRHEGVVPQVWSWVDGAVVKALEEGGFLVLDELNLAPTEATERLNALLETPPSFVLSEKSGEVYGHEGRPIHPDLRIVGTRNPSTYGGRSALSPALLSRFRAQRIVPEPTEEDFEQMLTFMVFGEAPTIDVQGEIFAAPEPRPDQRYAGVRALSKIRRALERLSRFHTSISQAANGQRAALGSEASGQVSRRTLISVIEYVEVTLRASTDSHPKTAELLQKAIVRYYLQPVDADQRSERMELMEASGLGREA